MSSISWDSVCIGRPGRLRPEFSDWSVVELDILCKSLESIAMKYTCWAALALRALLIVWSRIQDDLLTVKYTDVDYHVFTDAARHVVNGQSPYDRPTYRYSPLLAWIVTPNIFLQVGGQQRKQTLNLDMWN